MLTIRKEQIRIFEHGKLAVFQEDAAKYLRKEYPESCEELGPAGLGELIEKGLAEARRRGIHTRGAVMIFIELRLVFGEGFELSPDRRWAQKILSHPVIPDYAKMQTIRARLIAASDGRVVRRSPPPEDSEPQ